MPMMMNAALLSPANDPLYMHRFRLGALIVGTAVWYMITYFFLRIRVFLLLVLVLGLDFDLEELGLIALMSPGAIGEPRPVHASQPAPAAKLPLFPWIMSRKVALPLAA